MKIRYYNKIKHGEKSSYIERRYLHFYFYWQNFTKTQYRIPRIGVQVYTEYLINF